LSCLNVKEGQDKGNHFNLTTLGLSQSAFLCIDIIARQFMKYKEWIKPMNEYLSDFVKLTERLSLEITSQRFTQLPSSEQDEVMKLLGSAMLCCGTLAGIAKAKALPFLAVCFLLPSHLSPSFSTSSHLVDRLSWVRF
jgi:hypothetical protein